MARKNFRGYLQGDRVHLQKYLYVLRPLLAVRWIDTGRGRPPMRFADRAAAVISDHHLLAEVNALLAMKMRSNEAEHGARLPASHDFINAELQGAVPVHEYRRPQGDGSALDQVLLETVLRFSP